MSDGSAFTTIEARLYQPDNKLAKMAKPNVTPIGKPYWMYLVKRFCRPRLASQKAINRSSSSFNIVQK